MELLEYTSRWNSHRLGSLFQEQKEKNTDFTRRNALKFTYGSIVDKPEYDLTPSLIDTYSKYTMVNTGDIIINCLNLNYDFVSQRIAIVKNDGIITSAYIALRARNEAINPMYYCYYFKAMDSRKMFHGMGTGIRLTLPYNELRNVPIPVPPRAEQDQIVWFLDWKVSEINKLIGIRQKEIKELNELTRVIVHHAITGKYLNAKTKQSGIEWIGTIPDTWEIRHVKNVANITNGCDPKTEGDIPVYGSGDGAFKTCGEYKEGPTVLIGRKGATLHIPHYVEGKYWNVDTAFDVHMKDKNDLKWFYYLSQCFDYQFYISQTTLPSMTQTDYNNMSIPVPSVSVQRDIASFLDDENSKINKLINLNERKIHALMELKASIISDVVTGKIDVRGITVPQYEHIDDIAEDDSEDVKEETDGEEE